MVRPLTRAAMARTGAWFAGAGALLGLVSIVTPHGASLDEGLLGGVSGAAAVLAVALVAGYDRLPLRAFHAAAVGGTLLTTVAVYAWGADSDYGPLPYVFVTFFAFCFFPLRGALAHMALIGAAYAGELAVESPPYTPVGDWLATVGTLTALGLTGSLLRDRLTAVIEKLTDVERRDPLTELLNRRGFEEAFDLELERARRAESALSLIVGDLEGFERLNEELGTRAGDQALHRLAGAIEATTRTFDSAARVGAEQLALLAPHADEHGAYILAERMRAEVERSFSTAPVPLTASFGIATFPLHGQSAGALLRAGDQALYAAKRLGGNRSVISSAEVPGILARAPSGQEDGQVELGTLLSLAEALDVRYSGNSAHCHRVARFAELMARELGLPPDAVEHVRLAGILHDVGRVGLPDSVLAKPGPLTDEEWDRVRSHPEIGARMVETTGFDDIRSWILRHHERPDGRGYPEGLQGDRLELEACILGVADAYEAMTSERPYRPALDADEAAAELRSGAGRQFDERVVEALLRVV